MMATSHRHKPASIDVRVRVFTVGSASLPLETQTRRARRFEHDGTTTAMVDIDVTTEPTCRFGTAAAQRSDNQDSAKILN